MSIATRLIVAAVTTLIAGQAWAGWMRVVDGANDDTYYIDVYTVRRAGDRVKAWGVIDNKKPQKLLDSSTLFRSVHELVEYDRLEERYRFLALTLSSSAMPKGTIVKDMSGEGE